LCAVVLSLPLDFPLYFIETVKHVKFVAANDGVCVLAGGVGVSLGVPEMRACAFVWFL